MVQGCCLGTQQYVLLSCRACCLNLSSPTTHTCVEQDASAVASTGRRADDVPCLKEVASGAPEKGPRTPDSAPPRTDGERTASSLPRTERLSDARIDDDTTMEQHASAQDATSSEQSSLVAVEEGSDEMGDGEVAEAERTADAAPSGSESPSTVVGEALEVDRGAQVLQIIEKTDTEDVVGVRAECGFVDILLEVHSCFQCLPPKGCHKLLHLELVGEPIRLAAIVCTWFCVHNNRIIASLGSMLVYPAAFGDRGHRSSLCMSFRCRLPLISPCP